MTDPSGMTSPAPAAPLHPVVARLAEIAEPVEVREKIAALDLATATAAVYLDKMPRPVALEQIPLLEYGTDLTLVAAALLDAAPGDTIHVEMGDLRLSFAAPSRQAAEPIHPAEASPQGAGEEPQSGSQSPPPQRAQDQGDDDTFRAELARVMGSIHDVVTRLNDRVAALESGQGGGKALTRQERYEQRLDEYERALHEAMVSNLRSRKSTDPAEVEDRIFARFSTMLQGFGQMFNGVAKTMHDTRETMEKFAPPPAQAAEEDAAMYLLREGVSALKGLASRAAKEPFDKGAAA